MNYLQEAIEDAIKGGWKEDVLARANCEYEIAGLTRPQGDTIGIWFRWVVRDGYAIREKSMEILRGEILSDPEFWRCLSKARNWEKKIVVRRGTVIGNFATPCSTEHPRGECFEEMGFGMDYLDPWAYQWHRFIDALAEDRTAEEFFEGLAGKQQS